MKLRRILCSVLLLCAIFTLAACNKDEGPTEYAVIFDSDGGTQVSTVYVEEGNAVAKPQDPAKDGYAFAGWFLDGVAWDFAGNAIEITININNNFFIYIL